MHFFNTKRHGRLIKTQRFDFGSLFTEARWRKSTTLGFETEETNCMDSRKLNLS
ncbi:hypothetical protein [Flagellimonas meridianipacifica]|uniref:Uncharacterized protein n=1 Tax=Flagellimonas meridianipacifica TaxID=1080225 RepID=A0A2T0MGV2_9FLAO|nr:hypothetical protein [Allomuricauda pacifica]PRX56810.1 hypothetical protein CLV81_0808 [Allomuricauda pacifica]